MTGMSPAERRALLLDRLQRDGKVNLNEFAQELDVSSMTVRRDLHRLTDQGVATISAGTAHLVGMGGIGSAVLPAIPQADEHLAQKQAIGRQAAQMVDDGDTIIVDCGSTPLQMLRHLGSKRVTIITNSLPVARLVGASPAIKLIYAPGEYASDSDGLVGPLTVDFFGSVRADKAFLGAHGFDAQGGVHEPVLGDATTKQAMIACSAASYLLVDASKYGKVHFMALSRLADFSCVVTDDSFAAELRPELEAACREVVYAR